MHLIFHVFILMFCGNIHLLAVDSYFLFLIFISLHTRLYLVCCDVSASSIWLLSY